MRRFLPTFFTIAIIATLSIVQRDVMVDIFARLGDVHPLALLPLLIAGCTVIVARGLFLRSCSPGISTRQAITADQSALAAGYGIAIGGGAVGTAMRIHMFTKWNLDPQRIATSIVATAVFPSFTTWGLPIVVLFIPTLQGSTTTVQSIAFWAGVVLVTTSFIFWWIALQSRLVFQLLSRGADIAHTQGLKRIPERFWRTRKFLTRIQPQTFTVELRMSLRHLVSTRFHLILLTSIGTLSTSFLCLWSASELFGATGLSILEAMIAFSLLRVLVALSPIPGAVGIAEVGLIALLEDAGMSLLDATGTTLIYRFLTWFLPIVVGTVCWWRFSHQQ